MGQRIRSGRQTAEGGGGNGGEPGVPSVRDRLPSGARSRRYWLIKSEPTTYGIDHIARDKKTSWGGVRNYQARNFMRDQMKVGDRAFFYHSNCDEPGIAGIVEVSSPAHPDETQFDRKSPYYDSGSKREEPRWLNVEFKFVKKTPLVSLAELRKHKKLAKMAVLQRGNRLSITPVDPAEWDYILKRLMGG